MGMKHPSGLDYEDIAYVSMEFWMMPENKSLSVSPSGTWSDPQVWDRLLAFQQGWKAAKDFYEINNERPST